MKLKLLSVAAIAVAISGSAFAQTSSGSPRLEDSTMMGQFYSDSDMKTMKTGDEFSAAMQNLKSEDREAISNECKNTNTQHSNFCDAFNAANNKM
ncbi:MAG: hypothetical protein INR68_04645 [Methylobacterium mesophilicum]|nr:hypothetical protein [Methylobacterium mesophilicum]